MKQQVNYISLMHETNEVGTHPARYSMHADGETVKLLPKSRYSFLFVLQGELKLTFPVQNKFRLSGAKMIAVDKKLITSLTCKGDTVILECEASGRMVPLMQGTSQAFKTPCSEKINLNGPLHEWCQNMLRDLQQDPSRDNDYYHGRCNELTNLLLNYPREVLGTLYIPLYACTLQCDICSKLFFRDDE